jgi:RNA polymerase sigma-70 factor, ECF subfamily
VFVLAEIEGMTAPEIAAALHINVNTVYSRLRAARLRLEQELDGHGAKGAVRG